MKKNEFLTKLTVSTLLGFGTVTSLSALVISQHPALLDEWTGPALLGAPPILGLLFFFYLKSVLGKSWTEVQPPEEAIREEKRTEAQGASPEPSESFDAKTDFETSPQPVEAESQKEVTETSGDLGAIKLLSILQQEGRLIDFLQEEIDEYDDAQIGAAAREVHRGCRAALTEVLGLSPVLSAEEGTPVEIEEDFDAGRIKLIGNVQGKPPFRGILRHGGWRYTKINLPETPTKKSDVLAPAEVEIT